MAEKIYELAIADKKHNPLATNAKHMVGNNFHVGNVRLIRGAWTKVNEWWLIKNQALIKKYMDQGQIVMRCPDGTVMGPQPGPAPALPPEAVPPEPPPLPEIPVEVVQAEAPLPEPEPLVVKDDLSVLPLKESKLKKILDLAGTFAEVVQLGMDGLVERAHLTPAQAEKVLEVAQAKLAERGV